MYDAIGYGHVYYKKKKVSSDFFCSEMNQAIDVKWREKKMIRWLY